MVIRESTKDEILNVLLSTKRFLFDSLLEDATVLSKTTDGIVLQLKYLAPNALVW
jgi:hypothetical protein